MKIIRSPIPEDKMKCMMLLVKLGSFSDGEYSGIAHLLEHLLVAFDKNRKHEERAIYDVVAHTSYEYIVFVIKYNYLLIQPDEVRQMLFSIERADAVCWDMLRACQSDVITEINRKRKAREEQIIPINQKALLQYMPFGRSDIISLIDKKYLEEYITKKYLPAKKLYIDVSRKRNHYNILVDGDTAGSHAYKGALEYIFADLIYLSCKNMQNRKGISESRAEDYLIYDLEVAGKNYVIGKGIKQQEIEDFLRSKEIFHNNLAKIRKTYFLTKHLDIDNMNHIIIRSLVDNASPFDLADIKRVLLKSTDKLYRMYLDFLRCVEIHIG